MANTRYKGANSSERLTLLTLSDSDMFQTRHLPGTVNDADKGVSKSLLQALPVAVCATAAATAAKVGTLAPESCPDFILVNGRVIHVYFSAANTASVPTINVAGTGAIPITYPNGDYVGDWAAGTTMDLMYISITVDNTAIERWVVVSSLPVDEVALNNMHSVTSNAVAESFSYVVGEEIKTGGKFFDGTNWKDVYKKVIEFGVLPNNSTKTVAHNLSNVIFLRVYGIAYASNIPGTYYYPLPYSTCSSAGVARNIEIAADGTNVEILTGADRSSLDTTYVTLEYIKTTD